MTERKIGILTVYESYARKGFVDQKTGYELKSGESFLEIELKEKCNGSLTEQVKKSFHEMADHIRQSQIKPKIIMGITYEKIANVAPRYGFITAETSIPSYVEESVKRNYEELSPLYKKGIPAGKISIIYQSTEDFLKRY